MISTSVNFKNGNTWIFIFVTSSAFLLLHFVAITGTFVYFVWWKLNWDTPNKTCCCSPGRGAELVIRLAGQLARKKNRILTSNNITEMKEGSYTFLLDQLLRTYFLVFNPPFILTCTYCVYSECTIDIHIKTHSIFIYNTSHTHRWGAKYVILGANRVRVTFSSLDVACIYRH